VGPIGVPELFVALFAFVLWLIPLAAGIWALVTLHRIRMEQHAVQTKLDAIERLLQRS
jgi:hypothetical protein